jgi:hypothetical protein
MHRFWSWLWRALVIALGTVVIVMVENDPDDVVSRVSEWYALGQKLLGHAPNPPDWLIAPTVDAVTWWGAVAVLVSVGISGVWLFRSSPAVAEGQARAPLREDAEAPQLSNPAQPPRPDPELVQLRLTIRRLKDTLLSYGEPSSQQSLVHDALKFVEESQHVIWMDEHTWELRKAFLHYAECLQLFRIRDGLAFSKRNCLDLEAALIEAATKLEHELSVHSPK